MSSSGPTKVAFHVASVALLTYPYYWIQTHPNRVNESYGWHFQMFTILTLTLAYAHFWACLASDLAPGSGALRALKRILLLLAAPCETLVSALYWPIKLYDPTLLAPEELIKTFPLAADVSMHALPTALLLVEALRFSEAIETSGVVAALAYAAYGAGYFLWTERNAALNGWYPYPMLELMSTGQRVALFSGATATAFLFFLLLKRVHASLHGRQGRVPAANNAHGKKVR